MNPPGRVKLALLLAAAAFFSWACYAHQFHLNDQHFMLWGWRHLPAQNVYSAAALLSVPFFLGQWLYARQPNARLFALALVMLSAFALMIAFLAVQLNPPDLIAIEYAVNNLPNGGYLREGVMFRDSGLTPAQILHRYPEILPKLLGHAYNKPPGVGLLHMSLVTRFPTDSSLPTQIGLAIAIAAALTIPATYAFIKHFTQNPDAAFCGSSFLALCPSILLFFPTMDQIFPLATVMLTLLWSQALKKNRLILSAAFGLAFAATLFFTYLPAVLIIFLLGITLLQSRSNPNLKFSRLTTHASYAIASFAFFYFALWLTTGFNPIASFLSAWRTEHDKMAHWYISFGLPPRRWPATIPWDLYSFDMGLAWVGILPALYYFLSPTPQYRLPLLCLSQFLLVALLGLFPGETIRLWIFMLPLLMIPTGLELSRWSPKPRLAAYTALLLVTTIMCQSLIFIV
jgi:hypothetical protein